MFFKDQRHKCEWRLCQKLGQHGGRQSDRGLQPQPTCQIAPGNNSLDVSQLENERKSALSFARWRYLVCLCLCVYVVDMDDKPREDTAAESTSPVSLVEVYDSAAKPPYHHVDQVTSIPPPPPVDEGLVEPGRVDRRQLPSTAEVAPSPSPVQQRPRSTTKCRVIAIGVSGQTPRLGQLCYETVEPPP